MMRSRLGVLIAGAFALGLALIVVLDLRRDTEPPSRELVPGLAVDGIRELAWPERGIVVRRDAKGGWAWDKPAGPADPRTVSDVLAALRGARWHRRVPLHVAGATHDTLVVDGATTLAIASRDSLPASSAAEGRRGSIAAPVERTEQAWLVHGTTAYLVDAWIVRALVPEPLALRVRVPFPDPAGARELALGSDVIVRGSPRQLVAPALIMLAPQVVEPLEHALGQLVVTALPQGPVAPGDQRIVVDGVAITGGGACGQRVAITGTYGDGCVETAAWQAVWRAAAALRGPPAEIADPRPVPFEPVQLVLPDKTTLEVKTRLRVGDRDADPGRVAELLAALAAPAEIVARPAGQPTGELVAIDASGAPHALDLYAGGVVARRGEPIALRIGQGAYALLVRPSAALRDPTVWLEEPTTVTSITIDGTTFTRGATLGEWTRSGPGRDEPALIHQLVEQLAMLRSRGGAPGPGTKRHDVTLQITPPIGSDKHVRTLTLAVLGAACIGNGELLLAPEICQLADKMLAR